MVIGSRSAPFVFGTLKSIVLSKTRLENLETFFLLKYPLCSKKFGYLLRRGCIRETMK